MSGDDRPGTQGRRDSPRGPRRTCVSCREEADRDDLVRLVLSPDQALVVDYRARLPGRGAWLHPRKACVERLTQRPGMLRRALGAQPDVGTLEADLRARVLGATLDGLSQAAAAGALVGGRDLLEKALAEGRVLEVVIASDAAPRTIEGLRRAADAEVPFIPVPLGREELGRRVGRGARAALGVLGSRASAHLRRQLHRLQTLG